MSKVYELSFRLGAQMAGNFAKTMTSASGALGQLNSRIGDIGRNQSSLQNLIRLREGVASSAREYQAARDRMRQLSEAMRRNPSAELARDLDRAQAAAERSRTSLYRKREELAAMNRTMGTANTSTAQLVQQQEQLARSAEIARRAQSNLQDAIAARDANTQRRGELRGQLFDAVALTATLAAPVRAAMGFEQAMAQVGAVSQASEQDLARLTTTARELGATTNWSASQAAEGMQYLSMAGFDATQTISAMPGMLDLASAGAVDLGAAADIASNILSGFSMEADQMGHLGDVLTNTFTSSNTSLNSLGETMKYVAPVANATGVSLEQAAAMAGRLGDAGIQGSQAGTSLRAVINRLAAPTGAAADALARLGIETQDAEGNMRDVPTILAEMDAAMQHMGTAARQEMTSAVFGMEAASAATILLGQAGSGALQDYAEALSESGSAARVAADQNNTAQGAMRRLASAGESIAITIGNVLLPPIATLAELTAKVVGVVDGLAQRFPVLTKVLVLGAAGMMALRIATIAGGYAFTFIRGAWLSGVVALRTVQAALALARLRMMSFSAAQVIAAAKTKLVTTAQWLWNAAMTANPIGLVIAGVAALIAAGVALYRNWDRVTEFFLSAWESVKSLFMRFTPLGWMMSGFSALTGYMSNFSFSALISGAWDGMKSMIMRFTPLGWMMSGFRALTSFLGDFSLFDSGRSILTTLASGIRSAVSAPINAVRDAFTAVRQWLPFSDARVGPFSELTESGYAILETLGEGMERFNVTSLAGPLGSLWSGIQSFLPGFGGETLDVSAERATGSSHGAAGGAAGGGVILELVQNITLGGTGDVAAQAREGAAAGAQDLVSALRQAMDQERRLSYD